MPQSQRSEPSASPVRHSECSAHQHVVAVADVAVDHRQLDVARRRLEGVDLEDAERRGEGHADGLARDHDGAPFTLALARGKLPAAWVARARCLWFAAPGQVEMRTRGVAAAGSRAQVLVRTTYSGISAGTELLAYRGQLDPDLPLDETIGALGGTFRYPFRYGYSCVGVVEQGADGVPEGDDRVRLPPAPGPLRRRRRRRRRRSARSAAARPRCTRSSRRRCRSRSTPGRCSTTTVVVFGLGAVGLLTCLLLRRAGARVVAVEPQPWRRELAEALGVDGGRRPTTLAPSSVPAGGRGLRQPGGAAAPRCRCWPTRARRSWRRGTAPRRSRCRSAPRSTAAG